MNVLKLLSAPLLISAIAVALTVSPRPLSDPDGGQSIGATQPNATTSVVTPGLVISEGDGGTTTWTLIVMTPGGVIVDVTQTDRDGLFEVTTGSWLGYQIDVLGTGAVGIPFTPGTPLTIVLP